METNRAKQIIVEVLQTSLIGHLDPSSNFKPQNVADAIAIKVDFEKTFTDSTCNEIIGSLIDNIVSAQKEMKNVLEKLIDEDKLLKNFIKGKLTAYDEILSALDTL